MHLIEAREVLESQVLKLYHRGNFSALNIARYLNLANPLKF